MGRARSLRRWVAVAAVALGSALTVVGIPAPAHAASAAIKVPNGILYRDCANHPVRVAASVPSSAREWVANLSLYRPNGEYMGVQTREGKSSGTKTTRWTLCLNGHPPGTYEVRMNGYWVDRSGDSHFFAQDTATFRMRNARSRTRISVSDATPRPGERVTVRSRTLEEVRGGRWAPPYYAYVQLQRRGDGSWRDVPSSSYFVNDNGVVTWQYAWRKRGSFDLRAFAHDLQGVRVSRSAPVTIRVRRGG